MARDQDLLARFDLVEQSGEMGFRLESPDAGHPSSTSFQPVYRC